MAWRGLHLTRPSRLSLAQSQVRIEQEEGEVRLAVEDIAWIVIDTPQATITSALLSTLAERGVAVILTDAAHTPSGVFLPFHGHHRQGEIARMQIALSGPLCKRLWRTIVRAKIANQAAALSAVGRGDAAPLSAMADRVRSGDPDNVEARAARAYWAAFWPAFRREDDGDRRNMLLNYGYAVVRAAVARGLVASGLLPAFGVHHASATNAFNLADDLVEPFRPFVDVLAWRTAGNGAPDRAPLTREDRQTMAGALLSPAIMGREAVTLLVATEMAAAALVRAMEGRTPAALLLPALPGPADRSAPPIAR